MKRHLALTGRPSPPGPAAPGAVAEVEEVEAAAAAAAAAAVSFLPQRNPQTRGWAHAAVGGRLPWESPLRASL